MYQLETIVAIATPHGRGGLGIVRISGTQARPVAQSVLAYEGKWTPRHAFVATLPGDDGVAIDHVVVTWFAGPKSYTGEDVVEISCHGAPVVLEYCVRRCLAAGARYALPGEFTLRAFLYGRFDLPRAEAVRDLIEANTLYQARVAAQQVSGAVSKRLAPLKKELLDLIALLEAGIDFADNDVDITPDEELLRRLDPLSAGIKRMAESFAFGKIVHDGLSLAIVGRPNVGKSSLFNRLVERDRAIVTDIPGTTRDTVSETASLCGIPVKFIDTAGIRESSDLVESLGIERSYQAMADADLTLVVLDISTPLEDDDRRLLDRVRGAARHIVVGNKSDLPRVVEIDADIAAVSALDGSGVEALRNGIAAMIGIGGDIAQEAGFITSARHESLLRESSEYLEKARGAILDRIPHEMLLLDLYAALQPIDAITGATTADDILNRIFSTFCIGK